MDKKTTLEQVIDKILRKTNDSKEQVLQHSDRIKKEFIARGFDENEAENMAPAALQAYYKKQLASRANLFEGVVLGMTNIFDMAKNPRGKIEEYINSEGLEKAIMHGYVNSEGQYLWQGPEWRKGKPIPTNHYQRTVFLIANPEGDDAPALCTLRLRGKNTETDVPMHCPVIFRAVKGKESDDGMTQLYDSAVTDFSKVDVSFDFTKFIELQKNMLLDHQISLDELKKWHEANEGNFNRMVITTVNCIRLTITDESVTSNVMEIDDISLQLDVDNIETVTVWIPKFIEPNWSEDSMNMVVVGQTSSYKKEGEMEESYSINAYGVWVHPAFRVEIATPITEDNDDSPQDINPGGD